MTPERRDDGFTLIELIASMSISAIIIAALSAALIGFYENGAYTSRRDSHSAGKSLLATYLNRDLSRAETTSTTTLTSCRDSADVLTLRWWDYATASATDPTPTRATEHVAEYLIETDTVTIRPGLAPGSVKELRRRTCDGTTAAGIVVDDKVLLRDLQSTDFFIGGTAGSCSAGIPLAVTVRHYEGDASADQVLRGCVDGRQR